MKKEPVTPDMILAMCEKFACVHDNMSDLRAAAAICVTAYAGFLPFDELAFLLKFCDGKCVELFIAKSQTDIYRNGNAVVLARTENVTCPFSLLSRYVQAANIDLSSNFVKVFSYLSIFSIHVDPSLPIPYEAPVFLIHKLGR